MQVYERMYELWLSRGRGVVKCRYRTLEDAVRDGRASFASAAIRMPLGSFYKWDEKGTVVLPATLPPTAYPARPRH